MTAVPLYVNPSPLTATRETNFYEYFILCLISWSSGSLSLEGFSLRLFQFLCYNYRFSPTLEKFKLKRWLLVFDCVFLYQNPTLCPHQLSYCSCFGGFLLVSVIVTTTSVIKDLACNCVMLWLQIAGNSAPLVSIHGSESVQFDF